MAKLSPENITRLRQLIADGKSIYQECDDLKSGLSDTIKSVSEELQVKPALINKLIKERQKDKTGQHRDDDDTMEELRNALGY